MWNLIATIVVAVATIVSVGASGSLAGTVDGGVQVAGQPAAPIPEALPRACVRMTRADYGGDGSTGTRDGIEVYVCDRFGIRPCAKDAPLAFEAAWGASGAVCVARPRTAENLSLAQLAERYPHLARRLGPDACTEERAMRDPATLLFNRSHQ